MSKQSGKRCQRWATPGYRVCPSHGSKTPRGVDLPQFRVGIYSRVMPAKLAERYMEALKDPELIEQKREAAIMQAMVEQAMARLDTGESGSHWERLQFAWEQYVAAKPAEKEGRLLFVGQLIRDGAAQIEAERELRTAILTKMKVSESERKRLVEASQVITAEELVALAASLAHAINIEVADRETKQRVLARFNRALSAGAERQGTA